MSARARLDGTQQDTRLVFECPGCQGSLHAPRVQGVRPWAWNGSLERPTLTPSIKVTWDTPKGQKVCHSYVTDGRIQYLADSTHALAGQTVDLPEIEALEQRVGEEPV